MDAEVREEGLTPDGHFLHVRLAVAQAALLSLAPAPLMTTLLDRIGRAQGYRHATYWRVLAGSKSLS